ncbi:MAG: hypothetical protein IVW51_08630 [Thermaceae bacterium]|nr:hypothetical protein [Thermaceae bacterium]
MWGSGRNNSWIGGLVLIGLGLVFLIQTLTGLEWGNWWALFILIPGVVALLQAYNFYRQDKTLTPRVSATAMGGLFPTLVALIFLFNWDWGKVWPLFLILAGVGTLLGGWGRRPSS